MARNRRARIFLETSGVIYHRHGNSLMRAAVKDAVGDGLLEVSNFIRMEYLRAVVVNLIDLYFLIKESDSVNDALIDWSQKVKQERKLKVVLITIPQWIVDQEDSRSKDKSLRRLGDLIVRLVYEFDEVFPGRSKDYLKCQLGRVHFPRATFSEDMLLRFYERFRGVQSGRPDCLLCCFKARQQANAIRRGIDLYSPAQRLNYAKYTGYVQQAERIEAAVASEDTAAACRWCERLGDTIIVLQAPPGAILVSADKAFEAFGQILNRPVRLLPSLANLKRQVQSGSQPG
jgi:hypothetical protein